jgi:hypothetical protein
MATYVNNLRLKEITTGDEDGTWGTSTNTNLELIADALGYNTQASFGSDANATTTVADGAADPARALYFKVTSGATLSATRELTIAPNTVSRLLWIENATTGSQTITIKQGSGATVNIATGKTKIVYLDGAGAGAAVVDALANVAAAGGGTVTSVGTTGTVNGITLTGTVTSSGNLTLGGTLGSVDLTSQITGTLPVGNGGTGITSLATGVATFLGTSSSANLASAVTDETGSGALVFGTSPTLVTPALGTPASGVLSGCTVDGTDAVGFRNVPQNSQSAPYTLVLADAGKHILHPAGDASTRTFTIPANASVAFPIGTAVTFINMTSQVVTIAITSDTMYLSDAGTTGSRSLAQYGSATAIKITATNWVISGSGLT